VLIHTDLMLSGAVAQYGRGVGMIQATAAQIINQFAGNLRAQLEQQPVAPPATPAPAQASPPPRRDQARAEPSRSPPPAPPPPAPPRPAPAKPISGLSLMARVIWQQIVALFTWRPRP
jgi:hypothetical protein